MIRMSKIAVIGDRDSILMFRATGVEVFPVEGAEEAERLLRSLAGEGYVCIFLTENLVSDLKPLLEEFAARPLPALSFIPTGAGSLGLAREKLKHIVEKAVGADILFQEGAGNSE